ncbi:MAG: glutaminyl-peptide cyclotransferase [Flavobacteriaceae bacterium]|nr:glutaminyl-peptide cyclotransferase [Bacteroidia bacterium]NNL15870.1 glutaminyl-peptide cyclotransferase [Flavobacteriaceae bacterium]
MKVFKRLSIFFMLILVSSCGSNSAQKKSDFKINFNSKSNKVSLNDVLAVSIENPKSHIIDSVVYTFNNKVVADTISFKDSKLGKQVISATVYYEGTKQNTSKKITVLNNAPPKVYTYKIINEYPHDIESYTQGLEFHNGALYESTGQRGESKLRNVNYKTGEVLKNVDLADEYFGEGLTVLNDNIYQLTWQKGTGFIYDINTLEKTSSFKYGKSKEGWGICNNGEVLYKSDGTEKIWILDPGTLEEKNYIQVYTNKGKVVGINELEWINGKIYANRYQKNGVAIINPNNGAIEAVIDFSPLKKLVKQHPTLDVLNGIAYNDVTNTLFVTGKRWDKLFEVQIIEK